MVEKVISGGQTGADIAGLQAAKHLGLQTGGWVPKGCVTQAGPAPWLVTEYGCREHPSNKYPPRTLANVRDSDATIRFAERLDSPGEKCTLKGITQYGKPHFDVDLSGNFDITEKVEEVRAWLIERNVRVLNVAGNSERTAPGIGTWVRNFLIMALGQK